MALDPTVPVGIPGDDLTNDPADSVESATYGQAIASDDSDKW
jgi:hypothetical protein